MKIVSIVGARPQFIKASAVSRALRPQHQEVLVHTGQHYDADMSDIFFRELEIPAPNYNLEVGSGPHGAQTGAMLARIEEVLARERPTGVLIYGDTNSTLAGALAAAKLHLPVAHVEAGLRSFNRAMPEEINRVVADQLSRLLFCPSRTAVENLAREGITRGVHVVGDVMCDELRFVAEKAQTQSKITGRLGLTDRSFLLATVHRAENTDDPARLRGILRALELLAETEPVIFPVHPRTRAALVQADFQSQASGLRLIAPLGYLDMVRLEGAARLILTDSGGIQKEAGWLGVPCVTLRDETEWVETVAAGWNVLAGADPERIVAAVRGFRVPHKRPELYGDGLAAQRIVERLNDLNEIPRCPPLTNSAK